MKNIGGVKMMKDKSIKFHFLFIEDEQKLVQVYRLLLHIYCMAAYLR